MPGKYNLFLLHKMFIRIKNYLFTAAVLLTVTFSYSFSQAAVDGQKENEIREKLAGILSAEEFQHRTEGKSFLKLVAEMLRDFFELLKKLFEKFKSETGTPGNVRGVPLENNAAVQVIGSFVVIAFIAVIVFFLIKNFRSSIRLSKKEEIDLLSVLKEPDELEKTALEFFEAGDFRQALRYLYICFLLRLNENNIIRIDRSKTNRQYLNEMNTNGFQRHALAVDFTGAFNRHWYGEADLDGITFRGWYDIYKLLVEGGAEDKC